MANKEIHPLVGIGFILLAVITSAFVFVATAHALIVFWKWCATWSGATW